jgi:uncharacterized membrane protein (DUF373 family)
MALSDASAKNEHTPSIKGWLLAAYEKFEQVVVVALSLVIALVILMTLVQLYERVVPLVLGGVLDPLDHTTFQALFGSIFTVLIAMEFKHSIVRAALRRDNVVQVKTVLLIALLAMSRKFVILDIETIPASAIAALGAVSLVLGIVYALLRDGDAR